MARRCKKPSSRPKTWQRRASGRIPGLRVAALEKASVDSGEAGGSQHLALDPPTLADWFCDSKSKFTLRVTNAKVSGLREGGGDGARDSCCCTPAVFICRACRETRGARGWERRLPKCQQACQSGQ